MDATAFYILSLYISSELADKRTADGRDSKRTIVRQVIKQQELAVRTWRPPERRLVRLAKAQRRRRLPHPHPHRSPPPRSFFIVPLVDGLQDDARLLPEAKTRRWECGPSYKEQALEARSGEREIDVCCHIDCNGSPVGQLRARNCDGTAQLLQLKAGAARYSSDSGMSRWGLSSFGADIH